MKHKKTRQKYFSKIANIFSTAMTAQSAPKQQKYSSTRIRKTQNEHIILVFQNFIGL